MSRKYRSEPGSRNPYRLGISPLFVGVIEDWEFAWMRPVLRTEPMSESELVRQQGGWVFAGSIANSILGFAFWALAAHLFTSTAVGTAGALVSLSSLATSIGILGLDNGLARFAARVDPPRALMWQVFLLGGVPFAIVGLALPTPCARFCKDPSSETGLALL